MEWINVPGSSTRSSAVRTLYDDANITEGAVYHLQAERPTIGYGSIEKHRYVYGMGVD